MINFKKGDRVRVIREHPPWKAIKYALKGWTGTIKESRKVYGNEYIITWDKNWRNKKCGDLVKDYQIELIEKKKPEIYGFAKWCKEYYKWNLN